MRVRRSLSGLWELRFDVEPIWRSAPVPGCWEALEGVSKLYAGPAWYRCTLAPLALASGERAWLHFGAVSYDCELFVNGRSAGSHRGLWDAFAVEITDLLDPDRSNALLLRVEKPAGLSAGYDSPSLPGRFPLRETLSGFLPYVWGHCFGGVWQDVTLIVTGPVAFHDLYVRGDASGRVLVEASLTGPSSVIVELRDPDGTMVATASGMAHASGDVARAVVETCLPNPRPWSPERPALYRAVVRADGGEVQTLRFGLRTLAADGARLHLNGRPVYPRLALSWGWYPEALHSNPGPERVRADLLRLRSLGYNGVKLCLWFPPSYYFDLADELGMLLWVELPLWLPRPTPALLAQAPSEYERLVRQARRHPSVILYSLGCELGSELSAELMGTLYDLVKGLAGDALVRDNSGSGEAYGGPLDEHADYDDHHFYSEPHLLPGLLDSFAPRWRAPRPWLLGEFCDLDTFRDLRRLAPDGTGPWWASADPALNPRGARNPLELPFHQERLRAAGLWDRGAELEALSERQALLHRKWTLELVRSYGELGGYVVSGEADTPITTAGMWDDTGRLKFDPAAFRAFNDDMVLLLGWGRRRAWVAGGDRPARFDPWCYSTGDAVRAYLILSNYGDAAGTGALTWSVAFDDGEPFAAGEAAVAMPVPGSVRELAVASFVAPKLEAPRRAVLQARLCVAGRSVENSWPLWIFPREPWQDMPAALLDPAGRLADLPPMAPAVRSAGVDLPRPGDEVIIATAWAPELAAFVAAGGGAVLLQASGGPPGPLPTLPAPFWREALRLVEPHPAWGDFPHEGWAGRLFACCAADSAMDISGTPEAVPLLRRLDTRTMALHAYAVELPWGVGRLIVSTLRLEGGQGDQPTGIAFSPAASSLLRCWIIYLQSICVNRTSRVS